MGKSRTAEQPLGKTKSEIEAIMNMRAGSELLLEALVRSHAQIVDRLTRKNGVGDGSNA